MKVKAEYIWIDGYEPTANLRSKLKYWMEQYLQFLNYQLGVLTGQDIAGRWRSSDCLLKPVWMCPDPIRGGKYFSHE